MAEYFFSNNMYKQCDLDAKKIGINWLRSQGHTIAHSDETMGIDLTATRQDGSFIYLECEIKRVWKEYWNPNWSTVQIPARKARYIEWYDPKDVFFMVISFYRNLAWLIPGTLLDNPFVYTAITCQREKVIKNDPMCEIPVKCCQLISLKGLNRNEN